MLRKFISFTSSWLQPVVTVITNLYWITRQRLAWNEVASFLLHCLSLVVSIVSQQFLIFNGNLKPIWNTKSFNFINQSEWLKKFLCVVKRYKIHLKSTTQWQFMLNEFFIVEVEISCTAVSEKKLSKRTISIYFIIKQVSWIRIE